MAREQKRWYIRILLAEEGTLAVYPTTRAEWEDSIGSPAWKHGYCHEDMSGKRMFWQASSEINHRIAGGVAWSYFNELRYQTNGVPF